MHTKTFFKGTDRNGYIPISSCHHPRWKVNIPKGQLLRLRRNCDSAEDFLTQADTNIERFKKKGYSPQALAKLKEKMSKVDQKNLLVQKNKATNSQQNMAFITGFNTQYKEFEFIFKKYWPILSKILPNKPTFIYRRAPSLRHHLVHNVINPPKKIHICPELKGFYKYQRCLACRVSKKQPRRKISFKSRIDHREYKIRDLITCNTTHVTYIIECPCHLQYVDHQTTMYPYT